MDQNQLLLLFLCALAALLHGISGFGFPMLSTAIVATVYPLSLSIVLVLLPCAVLNLVVLFSLLRVFATLYAYLKHYFVLILASLVGTLLGVGLLFYLSEKYLKIILGVILLSYVADQLRTQPLQLHASLHNMLFFGLATGMIGGATNAMAPLLILYLMATQHHKNDVVIISNLIFLLAKLVQLFLLWPMLKQQIWINGQLILLLSLVAVFGVLIANQFRQKLSQQNFRWMILSLLGLLGLQALYQATQL